MLGLRTLYNAYREIREWKILYNVTKDPFIEKELKSFGFKLSWLGVPYKVLEIPSEFMETEQTYNSYIFGKLVEIGDNITGPLRLTDIVYPATNNIAPGLVLIKLESKTEFLRLKLILPILLGWGIGSYLSYRVWIKYDLWQYLEQSWDFIYSIFF